MKIVHVLTYVSDDGAYGGPVAVARAQCVELARRGHDVHLVAGWDGVAKFDAPGVRVHLHRVVRLKRSFSSVLSLSLLRRVWMLSRTADVVHLHLARDLVQLPAGLLSRRATLVAQPHGMVVPDTRMSVRLVDIIGTLTVLRRLSAVLALTEVESRSLAALNVICPIERVRNGIAPSEKRACWDGSRPLVVFLARMHSRKRPATFVKMAAEVNKMLPNVRFAMYGADEGERLPVLDLIRDLRLEGVVCHLGALKPGDVTGVLCNSQVFVLPSVDEPFPVTVLEAMACGLPVVITDQTGISAELDARASASVTDGTPDSLAEAVVSLCRSEEAWHEASRVASHDALANFSMQSVADELAEIYERARSTG